MYIQYGNIFFNEYFYNKCELVEGAEKNNDGINFLYLKNNVFP